MRRSRQGRGAHGRLQPATAMSKVSGPRTGPRSREREYSPPIAKTPLVDNSPPSGCSSMVFQFFAAAKPLVGRPKPARWHLRMPPIPRDLPLLPPPTAAPYTPPRLRAERTSPVSVPPARRSGAKPYGAPGVVSPQMWISLWTGLWSQRVRHRRRRWRRIPLLSTGTISAAQSAPRSAR